MNEAHNVQRNCLRAEYMEAILKEHKTWAQKCKAKWLVEGDENSCFFHRLASARKSKIVICVLEKVDGNLLTDGNNIEIEFTDYFTKLYGDSKVRDFFY